MNIMTVCGLGVLAGFCAFALRNFGWRGVPLFVIAAALFLLSGQLPVFREAGEVFSTLARVEGLGEGTGTVLRIVGVGYLCGITADVCRELGEGGVARAVTVAGKCGLLALALPYLSSLLALGLSRAG